MFDLQAPIEDVPLAFLDVETTGLRPQFGDRVCEVAVLRCQGDQVLDAMQQLVNPERPMGRGAYAVHGISDEMVRDAPKFGDIAPEVLALLDGAVLVGHNTRFDLGFMAAELALLQAELPPLIALDTLRLARRSYRLSGYGLEVLARALDVQVSGQAHRAMGDVLRTRALLQRLVHDLWPQGLRSLEDLLAAQGGPIKWGPLPNLDIPPIIRESLLRNLFLYVRYRAEGGEETERLVRPLTVVERGGHLLLVAHCLLRDSRRSFRLDRILDAELVEAFD